MSRHKCALGLVPILTATQLKVQAQDADNGAPGYGHIDRDYSAEPEGTFCAPYNLQTIPRGEWSDRLKELKANKALLSDLLASRKWTVKNQKSTPLCWVFAATGAYEVSLLSRQNVKTRLSPASTGAYVQSWRMAGGWSSQAVKEIGNRGIVPSSMWPDTSYDRKYDNAETKAERQKWRLTEWLDLSRRNFDQLATCLLSGFPVAVGFNHWRHAVFAVDLVQQGSSWGILFANSWGSSYGTNGFGVLMDSKAIPDDAVCPTVGLHQ